MSELKVEIKCDVCGKVCETMRALSIHLAKAHKMEIVVKQSYYDKYFLKDGEDKCFFCGKKSKFKSFEQGYFRYCDSSICLGKTRATNTPENKMYVHGMTYDEAVIACAEYTKKRVDVLKANNESRLEVNLNYHKEKSHNTVEFWLKRGFSENDAKDKAYDVMKNIHSKNREYRVLYPERYKDVNTTQLLYWVKKGYSESDAKQMLSLRQSTFTLDKCIDKYGDDEGKRIYSDRHRKWSEKMEEMYNNGEYSRANFTLHTPSSKNEYELANGILSKLDIDLKFGKNQVREQYNNKKTMFYDFKYGNKIIELYGDFWHCNPILYQPDYFNKRKGKLASEIWEHDNKRVDMMVEKGYDVLVIWEHDLKNNNDSVIRDCINFLNS